MITNNLYVIAAVCGNFWRESGVNPGIWENLTVGDPGFGLGQWTDLPQYGLTRRTQLFNWLSLNGYPNDSGQGQLEYLIYENYWTPASIQQSAYSSLSDFLQSTSTSINDLTLEYMYHWEGINDPQANDRITAAQNFYTLFTNDPGTRDPWYAMNAYLTVNQQNNNALLVMDFFLGNTPPPGPGPGPGPGADGTLYAQFKTILNRRRNRGWNIV